MYRSCLLMMDGTAWFRTGVWRGLNLSPQESFQEIERSEIFFLLIAIIIMISSSSFKTFEDMKKWCGQGCQIFQVQKTLTVHRGVPVSPVRRPSPLRPTRLDIDQRGDFGRRNS